MNKMIDDIYVLKLRDSGRCLLSLDVKMLRGQELQRGGWFMSVLST